MSVRCDDGRPLAAKVPAVNAEWEEPQAAELAVQAEHVLLVGGGSDNDVAASFQNCREVVTSHEDEKYAGVR
jgi:hypothetical protein